MKIYNLLINFLVQVELFIWNIFKKIVLFIWNILRMIVLFPFAILFALAMGYADGQIGKKDKK